MKKSLLALAVLGVFAGAAQAQSSVTLFGILDASGKYVKNDGSNRRLSLANSGINSSRLGFRGVEDLGGGLRAGFWLEAGLGNDDGTAGSTTGGKLFNRRSTVSLISGAGELRLGRDYTPTFWNQTVFDAFGTNGVGSSLNVSRGVTAGVRSDNSIGYHLPSNIGGFYGQAMVAASESGTTLDRPGRNVSGRIGFAAGPFDVAVSAGDQRFTVANGGQPAGDKQRTYNVGGSWDFGIGKILGYYQRDRFNATTDSRLSVSGLFRMGQGEIRVGYDRAEIELASVSPGLPVTEATVDQIKATYQYNLSKRTAMYGTISRLANKDAATALAIGGGNPISAGGDSKAFELGVRHIF